MRPNIAPLDPQESGGASVASAVSEEERRGLMSVRSGAPLQSVA